MFSPNEIPVNEKMIPAHHDDTSDPGLEYHSGSEDSTEGEVESRKRIEAMKASIRKAMLPIKNQYKNRKSGSEVQVNYDRACIQLFPLISEKCRQHPTVGLEGSNDKVSSSLILERVRQLSDDVTSSSEQEDRRCFQLIELLSDFFEWKNSLDVDVTSSLDAVYNVLGFVHRQLIESIKEPSNFFKMQNITPIMLVRDYVKVVLKFQFYESIIHPEIEHMRPWLKLLQNLTPAEFIENDFLARFTGHHHLHYLMLGNTRSEVDNLTDDDHSKENAKLTAKVGFQIFNAVSVDPSTQAHDIFKVKYDELTAILSAAIGYDKITTAAFGKIYFSKLLAFSSDLLDQDEKLLYSFAERFNSLNLPKKSNAASLVAKCIFVTACDRAAYLAQHPKIDFYPGGLFQARLRKRNAEQLEYKEDKRQRPSTPSL